LSLKEKWPFGFWLPHRPCHSSHGGPHQYDIDRRGLGDCDRLVQSSKENVKSLGGDDQNVKSLAGDEQRFRHLKIHVCENTCSILGEEAYRIVTNMISSSSPARIELHRLRCGSEGRIHTRIAEGEGSIQEDKDPGLLFIRLRRFGGCRKRIPTRIFRQGDCGFHPRKHRCRIPTTLLRKVAQCLFATREKLAAKGGMDMVGMPQPSQ